MNHPDTSTPDLVFLEQLVRFQDGALPADEIAALEAAMEEDPEKRRSFAVMQLRSMALHDQFRHEAFRSPDPVASSFRRTLRPALAAAAGLVIGLFGASVVWAISSPRATTERLFSLVNGGFEEAEPGRGFPTGTGFWSGDEAGTVETGSSEGGRRLRFENPGGDAGNPEGQAISCDVFQLVDLRPLRASLSAKGEAVLELSARFLDARPHNTKPSITFFCQIYLFRGDPAAIHKTWPMNLSESLASASGMVTTLGGSPADWKDLAAKCLVSEEADFAVIQIAARPNLRPAKLESLFADDVMLTLKTQPALPVRTVQR